MAAAANPDRRRVARLRLLFGLFGLALIGFVVAACSSDEESRQWYLNELERTSTFAPEEARCYVDGVADELGVHALDTAKAVPVADRVRIAEIQNECLGVPNAPVGFVGPELPESEDGATKDGGGENRLDEDDLDRDALPDVNYNRRKNVIRRLKNRLGLSTWDASCLIDSVMAETDRAVVTWAAASPRLQNQVLASCLQDHHHE